MSMMRANACFKTMAHRMEGWEQGFAHAAEKLQLLSPLATLSRDMRSPGSCPRKKILKNAALLRPDDQIEVQLRDGKVYAEVKRTEI